VAAISALTGDLAALTHHVKPGETAALFGSSGVGKSTIANRLLGAERQATGVAPGRHVTTSRQLVLLPADWWLLDTPGLRELALDATVDAVDEAFAGSKPTPSGRATRWPPAPKKSAGRRSTKPCASPVNYCRIRRSISAAIRSRYSGFRTSVRIPNS